MDLSNNNPIKRKTPVEYDFMKDARKIIRGDFPKMRRMKRRIALEILGLVALLMTSGWLQYKLPFETIWITIIVILFIAAFMTLEIFAFRAYWYTPTDINRADALRKFSDHLNSVTQPMKLIKILLASFIGGVLTVVFGLETMHDAHFGVYSGFISWQMIVLLLLVQVSLSIFSARWISSAKLAREKLVKYQKMSKHGHGR